MNVAEKTLFNVFRKELKLPDDSAATLLEAVENFLEFERLNANSSVATKEDIRKLELQLETLKENNHNLELKIEQSKTELYRAIDQSRNDIYKAVYLSSLLQFLGIVGAVIAIVKFMLK